MPCAAQYWSFVPVVPAVVVTGGGAVVDAGGAVVDAGGAVVDAGGAVVDAGGAVVDGGGGGCVVVVAAGAGVGNAIPLRKIRLFKRDAVKAIPNTGMMVSRSSMLCLAVLSTNWSKVSSASSNSKAKPMPNAMHRKVKVRKNLMVAIPVAH